MVSLRFSPSNFHFNWRNNDNPISKSSNSNPLSSSLAFALAAGAAALAGLATTAAKATTIENDSKTNSPSFPWSSISLAETDSSNSTAEPRTGMVFPSKIGGSRHLLGVGLRKKSILGLKNIDIYAFGVYADDNELKRALGEKYRNVSASELKEHKGFEADLLEADVCMTVRLKIAYGKLSIKSVRSAFEDSVGSRLKKYGEDDPELLQRFTSQFKDEYKIPRGSVIELSREKGHILRTTIDGNEIGRIQSKLLCKSILDLYIGDEPFDKGAKEEIKKKVGSFLK